MAWCCDKFSFIAWPKSGWLTIFLINLIFGLAGVFICCYKLKYVTDDDDKMEFFKLSMIFAACNLVLSFLLLVSVLKNHHKWALFYAFLCFLSLFSATIHIESNTTHNVIVIVIFTIFGILCCFWFCLYATYLLIMPEKEETVRVDDFILTPLPAEL